MNIKDNFLGLKKKAIDFINKGDSQEDTRIRVTAIVFVTALIAMIPSIMTTYMTNDSIAPVLPIIGTMVVVVIALVVLLTKKDLSLAGYIAIIGANFIILPWMFFTNGGSRSGMPVWFLMGLIFDYFIIHGKWSYLVIVLNIAGIGACFVAEYYFPHIVRPLASPQAMFIDIVQSIVLCGFVFGVVFKYQIYSYDRKNAELLKREKDFMEANSKLEHASNAKSEFLANVSHEIRTPINAVLGMDEMILRESKEQKTIECARNIQSAGHTLLALINDLLDVTKMESGKMEIIPCEYSPMSMLVDSYNVIAVRAADKELPVYVENDINIPATLYGDEIRVRQMITNLLTNAVKYTSSGEIVVRLTYEKIDNSRIMLIAEVKDTGAGISTADQEKLFSNFVRIDEKKNRTIEGTGLGLSIVKQLCELMHGSIAVDSVYGVGSTFRIAVPQDVISWEAGGSFEEAYRHEASESEYHESFHAPDAKILAVDDVEINLEVLKLVLSETQIQVDVAGGGQECIDKVRCDRYDLILLDHMMPEIDGAEALRRIRLMDGNPNRDIPVIVLTANAVAGAREKYLEMGFNDYMEKPIDTKVLEEKLIKFLPKELVHLE